MFLIWIEWLMSLYLTANHYWVFFVGLAPFVLLLCCFGDETQVWLGDLRVVLVCDFAVLCVDLPFYRYRPIALGIAFSTAYLFIRTVPQSIYGQARGKKKRHWCGNGAAVCLVRSGSEEEGKPAFTCNAQDHFALPGLAFQEWRWATGTSSRCTRGGRASLFDGRKGNVWRSIGQWVSGRVEPVKLLFGFRRGFEIGPHSWGWRDL